MRFGGFSFLAFGFSEFTCFSPCVQASAFCKECSPFLGKVTKECCSAQTRSTLQMYAARLDGEFSTLHFQALKAEACAAGAGASGVMRMWNAAWVQCQQVRQCLEEMHTKKKGVDKNQIQHTTTANHQGADGGMEKEKNEVGENEYLLTQPPSPKESANASESVGESNTAACFNHHLPPDIKEESVQKSPERLVDNKEVTSLCNPDTKWRPREHHSETDLRSTVSAGVGDDFPLHRILGRSLSEGSCVSSHLISISGISPLSIRNKHCQIRTQPLELNPQPIQNLPTCHDGSLHSGDLSCVSKGDSNEEKAEGCTVSTPSSETIRTPETLFIPTENNGSNVL